MNDTSRKIPFEMRIRMFNAMYKLPLSDFPSALAVIADEEERNPPPISGSERESLAGRLFSFKKTLADELDEIDDVIANLIDPEEPGKKLYPPVEFLTEMADLLGDLIVYCASEMVKYGIPVVDTLNIIMDSNRSKLQLDGSVRYDKDGKVLKGPRYWKPEPHIQAMLLERMPQNISKVG